MSDDVHNQEQAKEIAQAVQKALVDSSSSKHQNVTINLNYSPVYNNYNGDNSINIVEHNNNNNQPMQIQTGPFLETTVYDSDEVSTFWARVTYMCIYVFPLLVITV